MRTQRIDLEDVSIAPVTPGVDHDLEIVIQFLTNIPAQLRGYGTVNSRIVARDSKVNFTPRIEHSYFRSLRSGAAFVRFSLPKIGDRGGLLPNRIIERTVQAWCTVDSDSFDNAFCRLCIGRASRF